MHRTSAAWAKQSVSLTGIGTDHFETQSQCVKHIEELLGRDFKEGELDPWNPSNTSGYLSIDMSNRYFKSAKECPCLRSIAFDTSIDPNGHLKSAGGAEYVHVQENVVEYYESVIDENGKKRQVFYQRCGNSINISDILDMSQSNLANSEWVIS